MTGPKGRDKVINSPFWERNFEKYFDELYSPLCRYCMKFVGDKDAAEDIVQEQFMYLWEHRLRLKDIASIKSYLFISVKHRSITHLKKQIIRNKGLNLDDLPENIYANKLPDPAKLLESKELEQILEGALAALPAKCRAIFTMKKFGEFTNKEIAQQLNISVKTVEAQMTIAFKRLAAFVSRHWGLIFLFLLDLSDLF